MSLKRLRQTLRHFRQQDTESIVAHLPEYRASCLLKARQPAGGEFCVQYGETDYGFLCPLLAEEGMSFMRNLPVKERARTRT